MATYEANAVEVALRALARAKIAELDIIVQQLAAGVDLPERLEMGAYVAEGRRIFSGDTAPDAPPAGENVRPLRRDLGVRFKRRTLLDIDVKYDSQPKPPKG